ncbi:MAG: hypothetical protein H6Q69_1525 [Firmicutes bacterium]|nr:hypothetical protein [Bacillota bacterium]
MEYTVEVYKSNRGKVLIVPYGFDKNGVRRALNFPKQLPSIQETGGLGLTVKESFLVSKNSPIIEDVKSFPNVFEAATGTKSWTKFAKEHLLVDCSWEPGQGFTFEPMERQNDSSYMPRKNQEIIKLNIDSSDEEIGQAIQKAFSFIEES